MSTDRASLHFAALQAEFSGLAAAAGALSAFQRADLDAPLRSGSALTGRVAISLFESQLTSRCLDLAGRWLRAQGKGYYTIASAGHEGNVVLGALAAPTDPWLLHYRSGAAVVERTSGRGGTPIFDLCLSFRAAADEPISGGRHKVFGNRERWILPQTSTIASHLPKALGTAFAIDRARVLPGVTLPVARDAITLCTFGDASLNHSTAQGSLNAARWARYQHIPTPLLLVCEDNSLGISLTTPAGWVETSVRQGRAAGDRRAPLVYIHGDGLDLVSAYDAASRAITLCRTQRRPVFLHLRTVRLFGHAGSDLEAAYRSPEEIRATEARDPVRATAHLLIQAGALHAAEVCALLAETRERVFAAAAEAADRPQIQSISAIVAPLPPLPAPPPKAPRPELTRSTDPGPNAASPPISTAEAATSPPHLPLARLLNQALAETLAAVPEALIFGEDVGGKGGVYGVTRGLQKRFGAQRVFSTLLDE